MKDPARAIVIAALILTIVLAGCSSSSEGAADSVPPASSGAEADLENERNVASSLDSATVADLQSAWSLSQKAKVKGNFYDASPVVDGGVVYLQDPRSNVEAIDLESGDLLWETRLDAPALGPNGVTVGDDKVFAATPSTAFALDAKSGKQLWSVKLTRNSSEKIAMTPGYHDGRAYFSTAPGEYRGNEVGVLWALDGGSGKRLWHFDTVPKGLWGRPEVNFGGGLSYAPSFDSEGSMYIGVSHAGPIPGTEKFPWGSSRPGPNLYSNSIVKLDEKTGRVEWHHQITPHGLCSGFLVSPVLAEARGRKVVVGGGFFGILVALDRETGKPLWRRPVGVHNGHDNDGLLAMRGEDEDLKIPMTVYPGIFGGITGPLSVQGSTVFVPVVNGGARVVSHTKVNPVGTPRGELVALDLATGEVRWKQRFPAPVFGPTTVTNDLVFVTSFDGVLSAFEVSSGKKAWSEKLSKSAEGGMTLTDDTVLVRTGYLFGGDPLELQAYRLPQ
jgi:outer membrane protein assembly factor BamB